MKNVIHAVLIALLAIALVAVFLVELRWHVIERFAGAYMDARNDSRDRLERFVDQESRTNQALEKANELIEQRSMVALDEVADSGRPDIEFAPPSDVVRLERGHKLIMTRDRFLAMPEWLTGAAYPSGTRTADRAGFRPYEPVVTPVAAGPDEPADTPADAPVATRADSLSLPPSAFEPDSLAAWTRTVVIRPGWIRQGEVYMVDDDNYILHRIPISAGQFDLIDAYASASEGRMHEDMEHVYEAGVFFDTLRSLDMEMRDEIIDPIRFSDLEETAQRVGVSENQRIIQIERLVDGQIAVVTIPVSADLFVELYVALGAL
ncbi:MAG: hypothetical protein F4X08_04565 [Gemmatimonadetes bacterium]|nr:hypothetical protein [Gemmatimonadota bacterium]MYD25068.1 hypothetical protein [Gemmatimonadota bacterium]MYJ00064.1 hypothetical protein [Gemmatimonadota bacterium]